MPTPISMTSIRDVKVFSGEYAAHPFNGMNRPDANTLGGALAEAAFLTRRGAQRGCRRAGLLCAAVSPAWAMPSGRPT